MHILCGTDIIEIERIKKSIERNGENFLNLIYTEAEIAYCESKKNAKYSHYAGRFAAKEAIYKAVSTLLPERFGISWKDAQIINDENGNPKIEFLKIEFEQIKSIDISISHCKEYAVATVTILIDE
jgi:holo-[acyl-carrier protein] synthase